MAAMKRASYFSKMTTEQVIAICRMVLAGSALLANAVDPSEPGSAMPTLDATLMVYVAYAVILTGVQFSNSVHPKRWFKQTVQIVDISFAVVVIIFGGNSSGLFFAFFYFSILSATLRWNFVGALETTVIALIFYLVIVSVGWLEQELHRVVIRAAYLVVAGISLGYLGATLSRTAARVGALARWPTATVDNNGLPSLDIILSHAATLTGSHRAVAVWERQDEPFVYTAVFSDGRTSFHRRQLGPSEEAAGIRPPVMHGSDQSYTTSSASDRRDVRHLMNGADAPHSVSARFAGSAYRGELVLTGLSSSIDEIQPFVEIVAERIGTEIERHLMRRQLIRAAEMRGRDRVFRDLHDGLLQGLTAIALQLKALESLCPIEVRLKLKGIRGIAAGLQDRVRQLSVEGSSKAAFAATDFKIAEELGDALRDAERQWECNASLRVTPQDAAASPRMGAQLILLLFEAIANAVRHGGAKSINIDVSRDLNRLVLNVRDDGRGIPNLVGEFDPESVFSHELGSRSLRQRVSELHGRLSLKSSATGTDIRVELPVL